MKKLLKIVSTVSILFIHQALSAQDAPEKPELLVNLQYFGTNSSLQYLKVRAMTKEDGKLVPVKAAAFQLYLDEAIQGNLIAKLKTDENGESKTSIPATLKDQWNTGPVHKFIAVSEATKKFAETTSETEIAKAKMVIDTLNEEGTRKISVQVLAFDSSGWSPVKDVELKIGVRRLGGDLKIGEEESYTTDSLGYALAEFKLNNLPAIDAKNNIVLVAKTEENEKFGTISFEKTVPWGQFTAYRSNFDERSLWATRDKTPLWLLLMAGAIIAGVWGVIVYLVFQLVKIKKLGKPDDQKAKGTTRQLDVAETTPSL